MPLNPNIPIGYIRLETDACIKKDDWKWNPLTSAWEICRHLVSQKVLESDIIIRKIK